MSRWQMRLAELRASRAVATAPVQNVQIVQKSTSVPIFERFEQIEHKTEALNPSAVSDSGDEEQGGESPLNWTEILARIDPNCPLGDVPRRRWLQFIDDCRQFLDDGWADKAAVLGWGAADLFGCDRHRPWARLDQAGLLWFIAGRRLVAVTADSATIETAGGGWQTYRRVPSGPGQVLAWSLCGDDRNFKLRNF